MQPKESKTKEFDSMSEYLANVSHDIRTPLNSIIGFSKILTKKLDNTSPLHEFSLNILESGNLLLNMLNDIFDLAKLDSDILDVTKTELDVLHLISNLVNFYKEEYKDKEIQVLLKSQIKSGSIFVTDEAKLSRIISNMLDNAFKFTNYGCITIEILVTVIDATTSKLKILIKDTGCGIENSIRSTVFTPFKVKNMSLEANHEGIGLGLAISHKLASLIDAELAFSSEVGIGSEFLIHFSDIPYTSIELIESNNYSVLQKLEENTVDALIQLIQTNKISAEDKLFITSKVKPLVSILKKSIDIEVVEQLIITLNELYGTTKIELLKELSTTLYQYLEVFNIKGLDNIITDLSKL